MNKALRMLATIFNFHASLLGVGPGRRQSHAERRRIHTVPEFLVRPLLESRYRRREFPAATDDLPQ